MTDQPPGPTQAYLLAEADIDLESIRVQLEIMEHGPMSLLERLWAEEQ